MLDAHGDVATFNLAFTTEPQGINNAGAIVGGLGFSFGTSEGFVLHRGGTSTIAIPGASSVSAYGVNNRGDIVGTYVEVGVHHGFVLRD